MPSKFEKNFIDNGGYLMKYTRGLNISPYKNWVLQFRVELDETLPLIWRRILVPSDYNFWDLHVAIQDALGWMDCHLHHFVIKGKGKRKVKSIGIPDMERMTENPTEIDPGWEIPASSGFNDLGITAKYLYDYGDSWWHTVQLEGYIFRDKNLEYPVCIDGAGACPPEDCGGCSGYYEMLDTLRNPDDPEREELKNWLGDWNPDRFDKNKIEFYDPYKRWRGAFLD